MNLKEWIHDQLNTAFGSFDWDYVTEDDDQMDELDQEPKQNFLYLVVRERPDDNEFALALYENILQAQDFVRDEMLYGDCMAEGGRGGPDYKSNWIILDLVERKIITVERKSTIEFTRK